MSIRWWSALAVLLCAIGARAESARWERVATPPRPILPAVTVTLGEPGYIADWNTPIELRAVAGEKPFDGYIGYHFEVDSNRTLDVPVVARAVLTPRQAWSFRTWVQLRGPRWRGESALLNRELVIEWRDRSMRVIGKSVLGKPPWSESRPLRVVRPGETVANCCLGVDAHVRTAPELATVAQWYRSFSEMIVPTEVWLDLPPAIRDAAFSSGVRMIFVGPPRQGQILTQLDRTLLPVDFVDQPGETIVPWPYADGTTRIPTPISWREKRGSRVATGGGSPWLVTDGHAWFAASEAALARPLPLMMVTPKPRWAGGKAKVRHWFLDIVSDARVAIAGGTAALLSVLLAFVLRRSARTAAIIASLVSVVVLFACRDQLRPRSASRIHETWSPAAPGISYQFRELHEYGPSPIPEHRASEEERTRWTSRRGAVRQEAEVRTPETAPGHGQMFLSREGAPWDSTSRSSSRRVLGEPLKVTIRQADDKKLTFDYEATFAPDFAHASWTVNGQLYEGQAKGDRSKRGRFVVEQGSRIPAVGRLALGGRSYHHDADIVLIQKSRHHTVLGRWSDPQVAKTPGRPEWGLHGKMHPQPDGSLRLTFVLPPIPAGSSVDVQITTGETLRVATLSNAEGSWPLTPQQGRVNHFSLDPDAIRRVGSGGFVVMTIEPAAPLSEIPFVHVNVKEKRS